MKRWTFIQLGNAEQCKVNHTTGWEYNIGFQTQLNSTYSYLCQRRNSKTRWNVHPQHATNFKLTIIFKENAAEGWEIPF